MSKLRWKRTKGPGNLKQDWLLREDDLRALQREVTAGGEWIVEGRTVIVSETETIECKNNRRAKLLALLRNAFVKLLNDNVKLRVKLEEAQSIMKDLIRNEGRHGDK